MRRPYIRENPKFYEAGTHPRDLRKKREQFEKGVAVAEATPVKASQKAQKPKKGAKKLKISTKQ